MKTKTRIGTAGTACALMTLLLSASALAQAPQITWDLDEALTQIERQADDFETFMARASVVTTSSDGTESRAVGTGFIRKDGMMRYDVDDSSVKRLVDRDKLMIHDATAKTVEEYRFRDHPGQLEPFIRLGFSTTGKDLRDNYLITILKEEAIGESRTLQMELTPKKDDARASIRNVQLWIDQASWLPKRQKINATDGSSMTITYEGMARNLNLRPELFSDNWPRGTEVNKN
jgi:outer membrane lipoprotein-sorting protein